VSDEQGFEVVDKRKVRAKEQPEGEAEAVSEEQVEAEAQAEQAPEQPAEAQAAAESETPEPDAGQHEHAQAADVFTIVTWMIGVLASSAWQKMGLQVDPGTGTVEKDLEQARIAIDCVISLADRISARLGDSDKRELRGIVSDLQINFVNQSK